MYGRTYIECNKTLDAYRKRYQHTKLISQYFYRCMDIHLKKLTEIKRASTVKRNNDEAKKLEEYLNRRN